MIEIGTYRLIITSPVFTKAENEDYNAVIKAQREKVVAFLREQSTVYNKAREDAGDTRNTSHLSIQEDPESPFTLRVSCVSAFKDFIKAQNTPLIKHLEAPAGAQFMVFAGFINSGHQSNVQSYGGGSNLGSRAFYHLSYGVAPGRALTEGEKEARINMNDAVFEKLKKGLESLKKQYPDYVIEAQEKQLGSIFVRVTSKENKEYGVQNYYVTSALGALVNDRDNVSAVLAGPELYPSDVEKLREDAKPKVPEQRKPQGLSL